MGYKIITMKRQLLLYLIKLFMGIVIIIICWLALTNIFVECGVIIPANYSETILEENRKRLDDIQQIKLERAIQTNAYKSYLRYERE